MDGDIPKGGVWNIKENSISNLVKLNQNWIVRQCTYIFPIYLSANEKPFDAKSVEKV